MVWGTWGDPFGSAQLDYKNAKSVPMQRGACAVLRRSVPMQRGARFLILSVSEEVQHGPSEGVANMYKTNAFLLMFKMNGMPRAATKWIPNSTNCKKTSGK